MVSDACGTGSCSSFSSSSFVFSSSSNFAHSLADAEATKPQAQNATRNPVRSSGMLLLTCLDDDALHSLNDSTQLPVRLLPLHMVPSREGL